MENLLHTSVLIIHVLGAGMIVSLGVFTVFVISKKPPVAENLKLVGELWEKIGIVFGLQILSGLYLAASEWDKFSKSPILGFKLGLIIVAGIIGTYQSRQQKKKLPIQPILPWATLVIYLLIISMGVFLLESGN